MIVSLIAAIGRPEFVRAEHVRDGAVAGEPRRVVLLEDERAVPALRAGRAVGPDRVLVALLGHRQVALETVRGRRSRVCLPQAFEITLRRRQHRGRARHRFDDDGGDGVGAVQRHHPLDIVGEFGAMLRLTLCKRVAGEIMGVTDVIDTRKMGRERAAVRHHAADRHAAETDTVIAALAADQAGAGRLACGAMIGQRHLQRGIASSL